MTRKFQQPVLLALTLVLGLLPACEEESAPGDTEGIARRKNGWLRGDLHFHTPYSDGWDPVDVVVAVGEYLENPTFLAFNPEYEGNGLDFLVVTDHNNVECHTDPDFTSDRLILIGGQEWTANGHANVWGTGSLIPRDANPDATGIADAEAAVDQAHAQGGLFSFNHPFLPTMELAWDIRNHDAIEVWNSGWSLMSPTFTQEDLAAWEADHGPASPMFRRAAQRQDLGGSMQALILYEAQLARGIHVAVVGGSDRHTGLPLGFPTTWVRTESADRDGILNGIRARHTFVSRTPVSSQVLLSVAVGANEPSHEMGDEIPIPPGGTEVTISIQVGRADGGLLRLMGGSAVDTDEALAAAELGSPVLEEPVAGNDFTTSITRTVVPGEWFYPVVLDPLIPAGLTAEQETLVRELAAEVAATGPEDTGRLVDIVVPLVPNVDLVFDGLACDPAEWDDWLLQCMTDDPYGMATFFVPDPLDRALNVLRDNGQITDWAMGAVGSAVRFVAE